MILSDRDIKIALDAGRIIVAPKIDYATQLGACSIDFRLGSKFRIFNHSSIPYLDPRKPFDEKELMREITVKENEPFIIQPHDFVLAITEEYFELPNDLMGRLEGRSSLGRLGIIIHSTAAVFNAGWKGKATMEIGNLGRMPVALYPGMRICAMVFEELTSPAEIPYCQNKLSKYVNQKGPLSSRIAKEW